MGWGTIGLGIRGLVRGCRIPRGAVRRLREDMDLGSPRSNMT